MDLVHGDYNSFNVQMHTKYSTLTSNAFYVPIIGGQSKKHISYSGFCCVLFQWLTLTTRIQRGENTTQVISLSPV